MTLVFLDTETTGLDPDRHEIWDLAYAVDDGPIESGRVTHSLRYADPAALAMNNYGPRSNEPFSVTVELDCRQHLEGATIVGANPAFDAAFLRARWGVMPWHHRLWDIEAYAAGVLDFETLNGLSGIAANLRVLGCEIPEPDQTAAGDVATLRACFRVLQEIAGDRS